MTEKKLIDAVQRPKVDLGFSHQKTPCLAFLDETVSTVLVDGFACRHFNDTEKVRLLYVSLSRPQYALF